MKNIKDFINESSYSKRGEKYDANEMRPMTIFLGKNEIDGEFSDLRIDPLTIPKNKYWYQLRSNDDDWSEPAAIKQGEITVNYYGIFITDEPIAELQGDTEMEITDFGFND